MQSSFSNQIRCIRPHLLVLMLLVMLMPSCSTPLDVKASTKVMPPKPHLAEKQYSTFDGDLLGYQKWLPAQKVPKTVIIGVHGISGHAGDYANLGEHLLKSNPDTALYAAETRGQGMDPVAQRRGDIRNPKEWYKDLYTFTGLIRKIHPKAKIVWFGESMGSLIMIHAYGQTPPGDQKPDAMVIASPIVDVDDKLPAWKLALAKTTAVLFPKLRLSLETLSGGEEAVVTEDDIHEEQAAKNPWYIKQYTLRLLLHLSKMSGSLEEQAAEVDCPVLLLHGGKDIFTSEASVKRLYTQFPQRPENVRKFYPESYHLLLYDHQRKKIFNDVSQWLKKLK